MDFDQERRFVPNDVVCSRGKMLSGPYEAELTFGGKHYLVGRHPSDYDAASKMAKDAVAEMVALMEAAGRKYIQEKGFKEAKE